MKPSLKKIGSLFVICLLALGAQAAVILQDNFDSYATGNLTNNSSGFWLGHSGAAPINVVLDSSVSAPNALQITPTLAQDVNATLTNAPYLSAGTVTNLYYKFTLRMSVTNLPTSAGTYFAHLKDTGTGNFRARTYALTSGAAAGFYRLGIANNGGATVATWATDLATNATYVVVVRYNVLTGFATLWVNPASESDTSITGTDAVGLLDISTMCFRQASGEGTMNVDNLVVGTAFTDVVGSSSPIFLTQPQDAGVFTGANASFVASVSGTAPLSFQWYYNTNTLITDATNTTLTLNNVTIGSSGTYSLVASNFVGTNVSRYALLTVSATPIPPVITNQPASTTNVIGDTVVFTVVAGGSPPLAYQWQVLTNGVTNIISGANSATFTISGVTTNLSGNQYFVAITNQFGLTNSSKATLIVNPPQVLTIAQFRNKVDSSFAPTNTTTSYTITGTVTTWADMTTGNNVEFYMQDGTGGIAVFWSGANPTNLPPAGALVQVTGPMAAFHGLREIAPVFGNALHPVVVISTNNSLPKAQPLVFDPLVTGNTNAMRAMESSYLVASNIMLNLSAQNFVANNNDTITNNAQKVSAFTNSVTTINFTNDAGQTFTLFVNTQSGLPGQAKYAGPVTVYGILGYFDGLWEFTPSRFADVISYLHVTNVLVNARPGDLATNNYTELVVRPGESLTTYISIGDAAGGVVTLTPVGPLPTGAAWSGITSGTTATAVFSYTGNAADAGNNFPIQLNVTSTAGTAYAQNFSVYVPTAPEQQMAITEFLTTPTTNPASVFYNPLVRASAVNGISTNDQYVEIVNQSLTSLDGSVGDKFTLDTGNASSPVFSSFDGSGALLASSNSLVVYGGNGSPAQIPGLASTAVSRGLFLPKTGSGVLVLRNAGGYIIDRVTYTGDATTNGSQSRFPTWASAIVPQPYVSTNAVTPGAQYDGGSWAALSKVPTGVTGVGISYVNGAAVLNFTASTTQASTLWGAGVVNGPYSVIFGQPFPSGVGTFTNLNAAAQQFYYISTQ